MNEIQWNNYSSKFKPKELKPGEVRRYRVLGSEKQKQTLLQLRAEDDVTDPFTGETIKIGAIKTKRAGQDPELYFIHLSENDQSCFVLFGNKREHREIDKFLQRCSYNKSNPFMDGEDDSKFIIEEIDVNSMVKRKASERRRVVKALAALNKMSEGELRTFMGNDNISDVDQLFVRAEKIVRDNPAIIEEVVIKEETMNRKALISAAEKEGYIKFDSKSSSWLNENGQVLFSYKKGVGVGKFDKFIEWSEGDGKSFMDDLTKKFSNS